MGNRRGYCAGGGAMTAQAKFTQADMKRAAAGVLAAGLPRSSIWAALEACAERMDEIADATISPLSCVEGRDHG